ncbi:MAG: hypothetical protein AAF489_06450, partial [Bacteroidota bacterium]
MRYPLYIAKRYLFSKSNKNAVNIISRIAVVAVIIGSMALFIVLSGFAGLKDFMTMMVVEVMMMVVVAAPRRCMQTRFFLTRIH